MNNTNGPKVAIIDYNMGNLFSVRNVCEYVGLNPLITSDKDEILHADAVLLPGVGAFGVAMSNLEHLDLIAPIKEFIAAGKPFIGICLGMQLLFTESEEFGIHKGLDIISGAVVKFPLTNRTGGRVKVPQVGWNSISLPAGKMDSFWKNTPLENVRSGDFMYFIHSYYPKPKDNAVVLTNTVYEDTLFCSSIHAKNIFACQFHPEKSAAQGLTIYASWAAMIKGTERIR